MSTLRPTALGLGHKAVVAIELHRRAYHAGELVTGVVHASIQEPIACDALVVTVSGKEKVAWTERHNDKTRARCKKHAIFSEKIVIAQFTPAFYAPGSYAYPFAYQLPANLPGVFSLRDHGAEWANGVHASISYSLKAALDVGGVRHPIPRAVCALPVHEPVLKAPPRSEDAVSRRVRYLRCIAKGACDVAVKMDRNAYHPGDTAMIQCDVRNDSQVALRSMRFTLRQDVTLNVGYSSRPQSQIIATYNFPGVRAGQHVTQSLPLPLQVLTDGSAPPATSTCGETVRCAYRVEIECDLPWSSGMVLRLPVTLVEPKGE